MRTTVGAGLQRTAVMVVLADGSSAETLKSGHLGKGETRRRPCPPGETALSPHR